MVAIVYREDVKLPVEYIGKGGKIALPAWKALNHELANGSNETKVRACKILQAEIRSHSDSAARLICSPDILEGLSAALQCGDETVIREVCTVIRMCSTSAGKLAGEAVAQSSGLLHRMCNLSVRTEDPAVIEALTRLSHHNEDFLWLVKTLIGVLRVQNRTEKSVLRRVVAVWRSTVVQQRTTTRMEILNSIRVEKNTIEPKQRMCDVEPANPSHTRVVCDVQVPPRRRSIHRVASDAIVTDRMCDVDGFDPRLASPRLRSTRRTVSGAAYSSVRAPKPSAVEPSLVASWSGHQPSISPSYVEFVKDTSPILSSVPSMQGRDETPSKKMAASLYSTFDEKPTAAPVKRQLLAKLELNSIEPQQSSHDLYFTQNSQSGAPKAGLYMTVDGKQPTSIGKAEMSEADIEAEFAKALDIIHKEQESAFSRLQPEEPDGSTGSSLIIWNDSPSRESSTATAIPETIPAITPASALDTVSEQSRSPCESARGPGLYMSTSAQRSGMCDVDDYILHRTTGPDWISSEPSKQSVCDVAPYLVNPPPVMEVIEDLQCSERGSSPEPFVSEEPEETEEFGAEQAEQTADNQKDDIDLYSSSRDWAQAPAYATANGQSMGPKAQQVESKVTGPDWIESLRDDELPPIASDSEGSDEEEDWC